MPQTKILNATGGDAGSVDLAESLFGAPVNESLIHQAVVRQQAGRRIGTADTLTRGECRLYDLDAHTTSGTRHKPYVFVSHRVSSGWGAAA